MPPIEPGQIVIVGSAGMLGQDLSDVLLDRHPATVCATRDEIDITDYWRTRWELERLEARTVVNCAAYTDVDGCETYPDRATQVNSVGAGNLARACHEVGARLLHVSTDFVFDGGQDTPYREDDPPHPVSVYGESKLAGERQVAEANPDHLIVRCAWLYGPRGNSFISTILDRARGGEPLRVVEDQCGTPTYTGDLALAIARLLALQATGVVHFANSGVCTRYEFAREALRLAGLEGAVMEPLRSEDLEDRPARRPPYSALDTGRFTELTGVLPRPWQETLSDYLEETS
jgi:dTDP-4-dehydrorhamnose reductase